MENKEINKKEINIKEFKAVAITKKARLIEFEGKKAWIPAKWYDNNGFLNKKAVKKIEDVRSGKVESVDKKEEKRCDISKYETRYENEKSVGKMIEFEYTVSSSLYRKMTTMCFFPKKLINENGEVPNWIFNKSLDNGLEYKGVSVEQLSHWTLA